MSDLFDSIYCAAMECTGTTRVMQIKANVDSSQLTCRNSLSSLFSIQVVNSHWYIQIFMLILDWGSANSWILTVISSIFISVDISFTAFQRFTQICPLTCSPSEEIQLDVKVITNNTPVQIQRSIFAYRFFDGYIITSICKQTDSWLTNFSFISRWVYFSCTSYSSFTAWHAKLKFPCFTILCNN